MKIKITLSLLALLLFSSCSNSNSLSGYWIGTITNEEGNFSLDIKGLPINSQVRISMVGFKSKTFTIEELSNEVAINENK